MELYLAHPFNIRKEIREWELEFENKTGIKLVNPFYDKKREDVINIDAGRKERYELTSKESNNIVLKDIGLIIRMDGILAFITGAISYGTIQEMVYAKVLSKPIYSVITNGHDKHPWLRYHSDKIFTDRKDLERFLINSIAPTPIQNI